MLPDSMFVNASGIGDIAVRNFLLFSAGQRPYDVCILDSRIYRMPVYEKSGKWDRFFWLTSH